MRRQHNVRRLAILFFLSISMNCLPQGSPENMVSKNTVLGELSINNNLALYSILYDRLLKPKGTLNFGIQAGFTYTPSIETAARRYSLLFPIRGYMLIGKSNHKLETGLGLRIEESFAYPEVIIGYRYRPKDEGFVFRGGYNFFATPVRFEHLVSVSIGYTFHD